MKITWTDRLVAVLGDRDVPNSSGRGIELIIVNKLNMNIQSFFGDSHWIMDIHPGSRHLAELVVHVVSLVEEQLQNKTMGRPCHCHLSYLDCIDMTLVKDLSITSFP